MAVEFGFEVACGSRYVDVACELEGRPLAFCISGAAEMTEHLVWIVKG